MTTTTPLFDIIKKEIVADGPMDIARFMALALGHPEHGYYMKQDPFGVGGDFTTAPEISQMFGEMIGVLCLEFWQSFECPVTLLECGPGRGTLMWDILRIAKNLPEFVKSADICLLETSPVLQAKQKERLAGYPVRWIEALDEVPRDKPVIAIANEFLDALPIRQYERVQGKSYERVIHEDLEFGLSQTPLRFHQEGVHEISPAREGWMEQFYALLKDTNGAGLFIDYGHLQSAPGDTLQAVHRHEYCGVLEHIGDADITAHVDFEPLLKKAETAGLRAETTTQGAFLNTLGIELRAAALLKKANEKQAQDIKTALHRLTAADQMGELFKVMGVSYGAAEKLAGF